jgi:hypothetical protein
LILDLFNTEKPAYEGMACGLGKMRVYYFDQKTGRSQYFRFGPGSEEASEAGWVGS